MFHLHVCQTLDSVLNLANQNRDCSCPFGSEHFPAVASFASSPSILDLGDQKKWSVSGLGAWKSDQTSSSCPKHRPVPKTWANHLRQKLDLLIISAYIDMFLHFLCSERSNSAAPAILPATHRFDGHPDALDRRVRPQG